MLQIGTFKICKKWYNRWNDWCKTTGYTSGKCIKTKNGHLLSTDDKCHGAESCTDWDTTGGTYVYVRKVYWRYYSLLGFAVNSFANGLEFITYRMGCNGYCPAQGIQIGASCVLPFGDRYDIVIGGDFYYHGNNSYFGNKIKLYFKPSEGSFYVNDEEVHPVTENFKTSIFEYTYNKNTKIGSFCGSKGCVDFKIW